MSQPKGNFAYTTLITRASYLAGVIILASTLRKHGSKYPLIVFYPSSLAAPAIRALELEVPKLNIILRECELLLPPSHVKIWLIAERFTDTWTKLRVFEAFDYDAVCYLDADMAIFNKNMDSIFAHAADLPGDWIAANHACVCNKERDAWAPEEWREENCAYTPLDHLTALTRPTPVNPDARPTYHLLNSGMFLYHPSEALWQNILHFFNTTDKLPTFKFPDQDFLAEYFRNRWRSLGFQYNALKTMRYWHPAMWRDDEVVCLHYIVDKPWTARVGADGKAGYRGNDGETHRWWWAAWDAWVAEKRANREEEVLGLVARYAAKGKGEDQGEVDADMRAIGAGVQAFAENKAPEVRDAKDGQSEQQNGKQSGGNLLRRLEHGHGAVVHPRGSSTMPP